MPTFRRLALVMTAIAALTGGSNALAGGQCHAKHDNACAQPGAACGAPTARGRCETYRHHTWRQVELSCVCRVPTPHGSVIVP